MTDFVKVKPPVWFWIVAVLFVIWNIFGVMNYLGSVTATAEGLTDQGFNAEQIEFMLNIPPLYASAFAMAVWSGLLASLLLLLKKKWAVPVYLVSLVFVALSFVFDFVGGTFDVLGGSYLGIMIFVLVMAVVEYLAARHFRNKSWLT